MSDEPITVFVVDDDKMFLSSLRHKLQEMFKSDIRVFSFTTGEDFLANARNKPDVVILDYHLDGEKPSAMNGLEVLKRIKAISADTVVMMLSMQDKLEVAAESIKNGAYEYVVKSETALLRIENILKNVIEQIKSNAQNKSYELWNYILGALIFLLILFDIIYYTTR
ncbi:MAG: response regulator transcription factor [Bacteroidota bacterium]